MPLVRPTHYMDEEFHKLPTKINDPPAIVCGMRAFELGVIGAEVLLFALLSVMLSGAALAIIGLFVVGIPTILCTGLIFWIAHSKMPKTYTHHIRFVMKTWNEPPQWTGDAFESIWGAPREELGKTVGRKPNKNKRKGS